jgi:polyisoprenoid-binding protein YceI
MSSLTAAGFLISAVLAPFSHAAPAAKSPKASPSPQVSATQPSRAGDHPIHGKAQIQVQLSPAGSFVAETDTLVCKDVAIVVGKYVATDCTMSVADLKTGIGLRDDHMKNKYMEAGKYPTARVARAEGADGKFTGTLELHGQTQPISGTYAVEGGAVVATFKTTATSYGINKANYMGVGAKDEVTVTLRATVHE